MPIDYSEYHPKWSLIRRLILKRAAKPLLAFSKGNYVEWAKCEQCGIPNYSYVSKDTREIKLPDEDNVTRIVLTIAHMDHDKNNNRFDNLKALCQKCHLAHDLPQHINNRKYGRKWKKDQYFLNFKKTEK